MARIKLDLPEFFSFTSVIPIRITDLNYGGHVGNDIVLSILHEARVQFLGYHGFKELNFAGVGLIMSDVAIEFRSEIFYGDILKASVMATGFTRVGFDIYYKVEKETNGKHILVASAKTGMICYNYGLKKIASVPDEGRIKLTSEPK
jgi:acyl-CoA thioester hydrolase